MRNTTGRPRSHTALNDKLIVTARVLEQAGNLLFERFGLTMRTYEILVRIHGGETTTAQLASMLQSSPANITHKTHLLERQRRIRRTMDREDRRVWHFSLTRHGTQVLQTVQDLYYGATRKLYAEFSRQDKARLFAFLDAIETHLNGVMDDTELLRRFVASRAAAAANR